MWVMMAEVIHKFGRNDAVGIAWEDVWVRGGTYTWPQAATKMHIFSSTAADTSAGSGARTIHLFGLDTNFNKLEEIVDMAGTSTAVSTNSFRRMNRAHLHDAGVYADLDNGGNAGTITINTSGGDAVGAITMSDGVGAGQTNLARYTAPAGLSMYVNSAFISVDSNQAADVAMWLREDADTVSAPFSPRRLQIQMDGLVGVEFWNPDTPLGPFPPKSDIWWSVKAGAQTAVTVDFEIILTPSTFQVSI